MIKRLHTVLVGLYNRIAPAEAHPLPIRSEKVQKKFPRNYTSSIILKTKLCPHGM